MGGFSQITLPFRRGRALVDRMTQHFNSLVCVLPSRSKVFPETGRGRTQGESEGLAKAVFYVIGFPWIINSLGCPDLVIQCLRNKGTAISPPAGIVEFPDQQLFRVPVFHWVYQIYLFTGFPDKTTRNQNKGESTGNRSKQHPSTVMNDYQPTQRSNNGY